MRYEYITIPAPMRSEKAKGAKTPSDRYAATLTEAINQMARNGWEYLRAETLPSEERSGLTGRTTLFHNLLIFRRETTEASQRTIEAPTTRAAPVAPSRPEPVAAPAAPEVAPKPAPQAEVTSSPVFSETMRLSEKADQDGSKPA